MMKKIDKIFYKSKSMSLDLYLEKVLYGKNFGYYQKKNPFGIKGDYITAPNISNVFCEMIAIWLVSFWENLKKPKNINFVELGPGNGDFCLALLKTLRNLPEILDAIKGVVLVDSVDDSDDTVCEAIQRLQPDYFANGGDRGRSNTPEQQVCEDLGVKMLWSIGGDEKLQSSTELTKKDRDFSPPPVRTTSPHSER